MEDTVTRLMRKERDRLARIQHEKQQRELMEKNRREIILKNMPIHREGPIGVANWDRGIKDE